jgi:hypothetical protein
LTSYLVFTGFNVFQPWELRRTWIDTAAAVAAFAIGLTSLGFGLSLLREGASPMLFMFGAVALSCAAADVRRIRSAAIFASTRLTRHLWRMSFALWIASASFFLGQAHKFFPAPLQSPLVIATPVIVPLAVMFYWLWRVRVKKSLPAFVLSRRPYS